MKNRILETKRLAPTVILLIIILAVAVLGKLTFKSYGDALYIKTVGLDIDEKLVIVDAGHGGEDCGAIGVSGVYEKDLNLQIALLVGEELQRKGYTVVYTRTEDKMLYRSDQNIKGIRKISDLKNRCEIAARYDKALFLSIHMNSFAQEKYSGLQVYSSSNNEKSRPIAESIQNKVRCDLQPSNNRKVKDGKGIYVLENISNPAVLVECGFLSNKDECEKLSEKEYQKQLSFSIVCGIIEYIEK